MSITVRSEKCFKKILSLACKALRPHQWLKNTLVFVPMLAAHQLTGNTLFSAAAAFICFSLVASGIYIFNDLVDLSADRTHPHKRYRPFAAGDIPLFHGTWMGIGLLAFGVSLSALMGSTFLLLILGYLVFTISYTLHFKHHIVIDICVLAGLYAARVFAGRFGSHTPPLWHQPDCISL